MVEQVGEDFPEGSLSRLHTWTASLASKRRLHSSRIVWSEWLLVNWLPDCNGQQVLFLLLSDCILKYIGATSSLFR